MAQKAGEWHQCHKCSTEWFINVVCRLKCKQEKGGIKKEKPQDPKISTKADESVWQFRKGLQNHQSQTPNQEPLQVLSQHYLLRLHQCSLTCTNHFRVRLIHSISELHSYVVPSVCAMAASSTTFSLLNDPTICTLCNEGGGRSTCQETPFHSLCTAMPTTICVLHVSSLC